MGFAKSIKSLFKGKGKGSKKEDDLFNPYEKSQKATVGRNKSMRMGIYEPYRSHFPLRQNPIPFDKSDLASDSQHQSHQKADSRYGGYDPTRMKLVTANGEFTRDRNGNYEQHIPAQMQGQLANNRRGPQSMYGSTDSIHSGIQQLYTSNLGARNGQLRGSTRSLDQFGGQSQLDLIKNGNGRMSLRSNMGSNSMSNMQQYQHQHQQYQNHYQQMPNMGHYQMWQPQFGQHQPSSRPGSVDPYQMMSSSTTSLNSSAYGFMSPTPQQQQQQHQAAPHHASQHQLSSHQQAPAPSLPKVPSLSQLTGLNFDPSGRPMTSDPNEIAQAVKKMEQCLQMLNSIQRNNPGNYQQHNLPPQQQQPQMLQPRAPPSLTAQPLRSSLRKPQALQPQPEFQEREARKKRRLRKKSDLSKFDLSELRKKLESVENDSTDSGGDSSGDKGFCDGSNPPSDGTVTPEKRESGSDSGESSDSGVSTPPPADLKMEKELKPILSVTKGILKRTNSH
ncbi:Oidioi.mRNA.OKI2018_I69.PAR.g8796.t1.cds [Oikopleura dioica]|uniref:Oidioi.mRNA.OKI2018_I69.PAR.g8796.t1.cds n=1 Tax=Oikopleura dioica TaxID=34765 RepID=A0ABN7RL63_OIKDI|nr:Oidioi.mRNA.OKI2018_I69.PAR.g8796.t1.cds [Oikopleura dioica]